MATTRDAIHAPSTAMRCWPRWRSCRRCSASKFNKETDMRERRGDRPRPVRVRFLGFSRPGAALAALILLGTGAIRAAGSGPPSRFGVDAPELARLGPDAVG